MPRKKREEIEISLVGFGSTVRSGVEYEFSSLDKKKIARSVQYDQGGERMVVMAVEAR